MAIVERLSDAQVGDEVWRFDPNARRTDANGRYEGRGAWNTDAITSETRLSWLCRHDKYAKLTGEERDNRGFGSKRRIAGQKERRDSEILGQSWRLMEAVKAVRDAEKLLQIAEIVGFSFTSS